MARVSVPKTPRGKAALRQEVARTILREAEERYRNELLDVEERMMLLDRINRLRRRVGLERMGS